ncbi:heme biosynthesis protein HemY [Chitinibacter fontanus]|uniref:Heme biosynthesis protein HemY n=1 Tax=Chitinibacter fontanus TaxID=1737446 RepID=A0A7D5V9F4_9NEIS|nr:heme biosynthesis HemY N-terminal domain-containing protein [Chitinibacter fontanus]QLI81415.1 heme biosynthesis protein HemY [Chitinibacter fontanus]
MKFLLWVIAIFSLAVGMTLFAQVNTGYALIFLPPWRMEISLNVFIVLLLVSIIALYLLLQMFVEVAGLPQRVRRYQANQAKEASVKLERDARIAFFEGRFQRAARLASEAMQASHEDDAFAVNGLLAARAAHATRDFEQRDKILQQLKQRLGEQHLATLMTAGELLLDERRYSEANQAISAARELAPKLTNAMKLELRLRQREQNPEAVLKLVEQLTKAEALDTEQAAHIRIAAQLQLLKQHPMTPVELKEWWKKLSSAEQHNPKLVYAAARSYVAQEAPEQAKETLEKALEADWNSELLPIYSQLELDLPHQMAQLQQAETWLKSHPRDEQLLLALGRLCRKRELWGKAQSYFEASIAVNPSATSHAELAELLTQLEREEEAAHHYRASLALAMK